jgi:uncharacterized protein YggE
MLKYVLSVLMLAFAAPAFAQITVVGEGKVSAEPDMATVTLGVVAEDANPKVATDKLNKQMNAVLEKLKELKLADKELCTANYSLEPKYVYKDPQNRQDPKLVGYTASSEVHVKVRDLTKLGTVVESAVTSGANTVHGVHFEVTDTEKLFDKAREQATVDAKRKAKIYADNLGVKVGAAKSVTESRPYSPGMYDSAPRSANSSGAAGFKAGERSFTLQVTIVFDIDTDSKPVARPRLPGKK